MKAKSLKVKLKSIEELNAASPEQPKFLRAVVKSQARNPQWVFAAIDGIEGKCVVAIPRRFTGKLEGKVINVEVIKDETGTSYRHEFLAPDITISRKWLLEQSDRLLWHEHNKRVREKNTD